MCPKDRKPEWTPDNAGKEFASRVIEGRGEVKSTRSHHTLRSGEIDLQALERGVLSGNRTLLSKAITLVESNSPRHQHLAQDLVTMLLPYSGNSLRIGITGTPGAGKSTFIESFGLFLILQGHKVAALAIDPSSSISKGSILGDKTRMEELSRHPSSFIRPSPSSGILGGVARKTRETIILCEAAGYDIILIETVGVGQSEITVRSLSDFFLLIQIAGAGDELQGIKKGIIELADLILINKADGDNIAQAETAASELNNALHYLSSYTEGWKTEALTCSALQKTNLDEILKRIQSFTQHTKGDGSFEKRRQLQNVQWFETLLQEAIIGEFFARNQKQSTYRNLKEQISQGLISPAKALNLLLK
ncbi:MAG: methylmalonyl Co-A mutase-associated GTPase MeaB [Candidatus Cloacimonetes bacterium]|nr:methylmalonyl Co-A mutase-associated GTPase MeaB [Candidatus Cloacimonadota bacterium]